MTRVTLIISFKILVIVMIDNCEAIIGGQEGVLENFSYLVSLNDSRGSFCSGSVIGENFVLTAAHCLTHFESIRRSPVKVVAGTNDLKDASSNAAVISADRVYVPSEYSWKKFSADIAVLRLRQPFKFNEKLNKINLPLEDKSYEDAIVSGFGWDMIKYKRQSSGKLRIATGKRSGKINFAKTIILDKKNCQAKYSVPFLRIFTRTIQKIRDSFICAQAVVNDSSARPRGVCIGDSGGPLARNNKVIGVMSFSPSSCDESKAPAVYTKVFSHLDFIVKAMNDEINDIDVAHADLRISNTHDKVDTDVL